MAEEVQAFPNGSYVRVWDRYHNESVIGRVIFLRGSEYHVSWVSASDSLFSMGFPPADMTALPVPEPAPVPEPSPEPTPPPPAPVPPAAPEPRRRKRAE